MLLPGNANTLAYDAGEARRSSWFQKNRMYAKKFSPVGTVTETQLVHEQCWPGLTVQLLEEPAHVTPVLLNPPRHLRLILLRSGAMRIGLNIGGREFTYHSAPGTVKITTNQHLPYEMNWVLLSQEPVRSAHIYLSNELLGKTAAAAGLDEALVELVEDVNIDDPLLYQLARSLTLEVENPLPLSDLYAESAAQMLAAQLLRRHCVFPHQLPDSRGKLSKERLRQVQDYVRAHLSEAIRLEELAALTFLSPHHFCRVFKRTTGLSPNQFVIRQRMERAVELLKGSGLSVANVAAAVGYTSHAHFTHLFVRFVGRLPTSYAK